MPLDIARIQALCFDIDGTLADTDDKYVQTLVRWLDPVRFAFPNQDPQFFARRFIMTFQAPGNTLYTIADRLGIDNNLRASMRFFQRQRKLLSDVDFLLMPNVHQTLERLYPHYPLAIVSARRRPSTEMFLTQFDLSGYFKTLATAETCKYTKPFPDQIQWAAKQIGVPPEGCLMIGDTVLDIRAGNAAGSQTVGVLCGFGRENDLRRVGADLILPCIEQLPDAILGA